MSVAEGDIFAATVVGEGNLVWFLTRPGVDHRYGIVIEKPCEDEEDEGIKKKYGKLTRGVSVRVVVESIEWDDGTGDFRTVTCIDARSGDEFTVHVDLCKR